MELVSIAYSVKLTRDEAETLYKAEELLNEIITAIPEQNGALAYFRQDAATAYDALQNANANFNVHLICEREKEE